MARLWNACDCVGFCAVLTKVETIIFRTEVSNASVFKTLGEKITQVRSEGR